MAPKFKGNSDDWLDSSESKGKSSRGGKTKAKKHARAAFLPPEEANATVAEVFPNLCRVRDDQTGAEYLCSYKRAELLGVSEGARERSPVAVGDRVRAERNTPQSGVVSGVCERRNRLARRAPGRESKSLHHVIAANVDCLAIVASARNPDFSPGLIDRFLVAASMAEIPALIILTKTDLLTLPRSPEVSAPWDLYRDLGIEVIETCAKDLDSVSALRVRMAADSVVFCGHSGVGKTSLLRVLIGSDVGRVGEVNSSTGKGQHTTTSAILLHGPQGARWIDTPGVREFGLIGLEPSELKKHFPDLSAAPCQIEGCLHETEIGCAAKSLARYPSYARILETLREESDGRI